MKYYENNDEDINIDIDLLQPYFIEDLEGLEIPNILQGMRCIV